MPDLVKVRLLRNLSQAELDGIGLFLGEDEEELRKMKLLFPRLIVTAPELLPEKLGSMLISLA